MRRANGMSSLRRLLARRANGLLYPSAEDLTRVANAQPERRVLDHEFRGFVALEPLHPVLLQRALITTFSSQNASATVWQEQYDIPTVRSMHRLRWHRALEQGCVDARSSRAALAYGYLPHGRAYAAGVLERRKPVPAGTSFRPR